MRYILRFIQTLQSSKVSRCKDFHFHPSHSVPEKQTNKHQNQTLFYYLSLMVQVLHIQYYPQCSVLCCTLTTVPLDLCCDRDGFLSDAVSHFVPISSPCFFHMTCFWWWRIRSTKPSTFNTRSFIISALTWVTSKQRNFPNMWSSGWIFHTIICLPVPTTDGLFHVWSCFAHSMDW